MLFGLLSLTRAGDIGDTLWVLTSEAIAPEGATLFSGVILIGIIVLFNASLDRFINFLLMGIQTILEWIASWERGSKSELVIGPRKEALKIGVRTVISRYSKHL